MAIESEKTIKVDSRVYLIDTENTLDITLLPLTELTANDTIVFFKSKHTGKLSNKNLKKIKQLKCKVTEEEVVTGTANAMDFQIVAFLTQSCLKNPYSIHYIVSNDKGFQAAISYINKQKIGFVKLISKETNVIPLVNNKKKKTKAKVKTSADVLIELEQALKPFEISTKEWKSVRQYFVKQRNKNGLMIALRRTFKGNRFKQVYKACLPYFKEYKSMSQETGDASQSK